MSFERMERLRAVGLMSGTSLDGLDLCYAHFYRTSNGWRVEGMLTKEVTYNSYWRSRLNNAFHLDENELDVLHLAFGKFLGEQTALFLKENNLEEKTDLIASHGHTVFHEPAKGITVQIGEANALLEQVGLPVVNDFRSLDVQLGGQGAPLVPIGDQKLFADYDACLNLGGISNISFELDGKRVAFDISPCNLPLNLLMRKHYQLEYDKNGDLAKSGCLIPDLFKELNELRYYKQAFPKSLAVEWLNENFYPLIEKYKSCAIPDLLHTIVVHETFQVAEVLSFYQIKHVLVTGGGAFNHFFLESLKNQTDTKIVIPSTEIVAFKEALVFAFLGVLRIQNEVNTLSSVTGASKDSVGGVITLP